MAFATAVHYAITSAGDRSCARSRHLASIRCRDEAASRIPCCGASHSSPRGRTELVRATLACGPHMAIDGPPQTTSLGNRFLLVRIAARRALQLRRGAQPRLAEPQLARVLSAGPERVALEEVRRGLVDYALAEEKEESQGATPADSTAGVPALNNEPRLEPEVSGAEQYDADVEVVMPDDVDNVRSADARPRPFEQVT